MVRAPAASPAVVLAEGSAIAIFARRLQRRLLGKKIFYLKLYYSWKGVEVEKGEERQMSSWPFEEMDV